MQVTVGGSSSKPVLLKFLNQEQVSLALMIKYYQNNDSFLFSFRFFSDALILGTA